MKNMNKILQLLAEYASLEKRKDYAYSKRDCKKLINKEFDNLMLGIHEESARIREEFSKIGINLGCSDYGSEYCLDIEGIKAVVDSIGLYDL